MIQTIIAIFRLGLVDPRPIAMCRATANDKLQVALTTDHELYLLNTTGDDIEFGPAEMFGYNVGSFTEKPRGLMPTCTFIFKKLSSAWLRGTLIYQRARLIPKK